MKNLHDTLREKERQLAELQKEVEALRTAAKILTEESDRPGASLVEAAAPSQPQMIKTVLLEKGRAMHVTKISDAIKKKYRVRLKPPYITSIIYRHIKKGGQVFRKEGGNAFGLLEWPPATHQDLKAGNSVRVQ
jgi:hypothetical protein